MTDAFQRLEKIAAFAAAFNRACLTYTHTAEFANSVKGVLANVTVDNHDVAIKQLFTLVSDYPEKAAAEIANTQDDVNLPAAPSLEGSLRKFTLPLLDALTS